MPDRLAVVLCLGSSCFSRGNQQLLETLESLLRERGWEERIALSGRLCENRCSCGPHIRVGGEDYGPLDEGALLDLLARKLDAPGVPATRASVRCRAAPRASARLRGDDATPA